MRAAAESVSAGTLRQPVEEIWVALLNRLPASLLAMAGNAIGGFELHFDWVTWLSKAVADRWSCLGTSRGSEPAAGSIRDLPKHDLLDFDDPLDGWIKKSFEHFARDLYFLQSQVGHFQQATEKNAD